VFCIQNQFLKIPKISYPKISIHFQAKEIFFPPFDTSFLNKTNNRIENIKINLYFDSTKQIPKNLKTFLVSSTYDKNKKINFLLTFVIFLSLRRKRRFIPFCFDISFLFLFFVTKSCCLFKKKNNFFSQSL
jgi:hypothetical protein